MNPNCYSNCLFFNAFPFSWIPAFAGMTAVKQCFILNRHSGESRNPVIWCTINDPVSKRIKNSPTTYLVSVHPEIFNMAILNLAQHNSENKSLYATIFL